MEKTLRFSYNGTVCKATITNEKPEKGRLVGRCRGYQLFNTATDGRFDPEAFIATKASNYGDAYETACYIFKIQTDKSVDAILQDLMEFLDEEVATGRLEQADADVIFYEVTK